MTQPIFFFPPTTHLPVPLAPSLFGEDAPQHHPQPTNPPQTTPPPHPHTHPPRATFPPPLICPVRNSFFKEAFPLPFDVKTWSLLFDPFLRPRSSNPPFLLLHRFGRFALKIVEGFTARAFPSNAVTTIETPVGCLMFPDNFFFSIGPLLSYPLLFLPSPPFFMGNYFALFFILVTKSRRPGGLVTGVPPAFLGFFFLQLFSFAKFLLFSNPGFDQVTIFFPLPPLLSFKEFPRTFLRALFCLLILCFVAPLLSKTPLERSPLPYTQVPTPLFSPAPCVKVCRFAYDNLVGFFPADGSHVHDLFFFPSPPVFFITLVFRAPLFFPLLIENGRYLGLFFFFSVQPVTSFLAHLVMAHCFYVTYLAPVFSSFVEPQPPNPQTPSCLPASPLSGFRFLEG